SVLPPPELNVRPSCSRPLFVSPPATLRSLPTELLLSSRLSVPPTVSPPLSDTAPPYCSSNVPATSDSPVSALLLVGVPASATNALVLPTISSPPPAIVPIPPEAYSSSDGPNRVIPVDSVPGATPEARIRSAAPLPTASRLIVPVLARSAAVTTAFVAA